MKITSFGCFFLEKIYKINVHVEQEVWKMRTPVMLQFHFAERSILNQLRSKFNVETS